MTLLITGAAGNIGRAVALAASTRGSSLVLSDHPGAADALADTVDACRAAGAAGVEHRTFDVTDATAIDEAVASLPEAPNAVFNNAGYQGEFRSIVDYDPSDLARVLAVNVAGVFHVLQSCARAMRDAAHPGAVVNCASMAGVSGAPNMAAYSASKAAVIGLTKSAAKDLAADGIRVNAISPGFIDSGVMWDRQVAEQAAASSQYYADDPAVVADQMIGQIPLRRAGSLDEVAASVLFLLSAEASYLTGINLEISGGAA